MHSLFFFFNDTATTEIYTLSLHDALPISGSPAPVLPGAPCVRPPRRGSDVIAGSALDRKSTRLNSSHLVISYAVFCLKKKKHNNYITTPRPITHTSSICTDHLTTLLCRRS